MELANLAPLVKFSKLSCNVHLKNHSTVMKGTGAKRNVCPGSCVSTGAKFPVAPVESAPMTEDVAAPLVYRQTIEHVTTVFTGNTESL